MILDANETSFFTRELEHVKAKTYDTKYKNLKATMLFPVSTEAGSGAETITYRSYTKVGRAKILSNYADDAPRVDVYGTENTVKVRRIADAYGYDRDEIKKAMRAGNSLPQRKADTAKRAVDQEVNRLAFSGDTIYGIQGFINYPGITEYTVVNGAAGTKTWSTKTSDEIVADVNGLVNAVVNTTNAVELPDTLLLPITQYNLIATKRMTNSGDKTILKYILETSPYLTKIDWVNELDGAGATGLDRMMCYVRDPDHITLELPEPFEQLPPEQRNFGYVINCESKCAGVIVYYPMSVAYGDGI